MLLKLRMGILALAATAVAWVVSGCGPDSGSSGSSSTPARQPAASAAPERPGLAVRSDYYTADVEAELQAAGLDPIDFRQGQRHYDLFCTNCHAAPTSASAPEPRAMLGPPSYAVAYYYRRAFPDARERSAAIAKFTARPTEEDAIMPWAVEQYGLMAPMPLSETQLNEISVFLATAEFVRPNWYRVKEE